MRFSGSVLIRRVAVCVFTLSLIVAAAAALIPRGGGSHDPGRHRGADREQARVEAGKVAQHRVEAQRHRRVSRAARLERVRSRTAYVDADRQETSAVMKRKFRPVVRLTDGMVKPEHVKRYTSDYTAIVDSGPGAKAAGGTALAVSSIPLRSRDAAGKVRPLDLSLRSRDGGLAPANPAVAFALPGDLGDGIQLPADIPLSVRSGNPAGIAPSRVGSSTALYPEVDTDTDLLAASSPRGLELFRLMRSPHSPDSQTLALRLPAGSKLEETADGGAAVRRDGKSLIAIGRPTASDAQGASVPVRMHVRGDSLQIDVERGKDDWAYPILVDPAIDSYASADFAGWVGFNNGNYSLSGDCMFGRECFGPSPNNYAGLNIYAWQGQRYAGGTFAGFGYRAPTDRSTFIARATLGYVGYYNGEQAVTPYMYAGLFDTTYGENARSVIERSWWLGTIDLARLGDSPMVKEVNVQLNNSPGADRVAQADHHAYVGSATIYLDDPDNPAFGNISRPPWVDQQAKPFALTVSDAGLGIAGLTVSKAGGPSWATSVGCAGGNRNPCPRTWSSPDSTLNYDPSALPQGVNNLTVTATDAAGHVSPNPATAQVRVDHTDPVVSLTGTLAAAGAGGN